MKTNLLTLAVTVVTAISFSPVALARPDFPVQRKTSGPAARGPSAMQSEVCKGSDCCTTKTVISVAQGGRGSHNSFKKVRHCKESCLVPAENKRPVCRQGHRA